MSDGASQRTVAKCLDCGSVCAVRKQSDGTIQPIGMRDGCYCGSAEFRVFGDASTPAPREENIQ